MAPVEDAGVLGDLEILVAESIELKKLVQHIEELRAQMDRISMLVARDKIV